MGRKQIQPIQQPDDYTCGPASLKVALQILGKRKSLPTLIDICKTNRNGTSTKNLIAAANKVGLYVLAVQYATLHHLQSALKYPPNKVRATLVTYLYDIDDNDKPHPESGHWATVAGYRSSDSRIVIFDSSYAIKKSYNWKDFRRRWIDYDMKRRNLNFDRERSFHFVKNWQPQLMLVMARDPNHLPRFKTAYSQLFEPSVN